MGAQCGEEGSGRAAWKACPLTGEKGARCLSLTRAPWQAPMGPLQQYSRLKKAGHMVSPWTLLRR